MRKIIITCDRCGQKIMNDINGDPHYLNKINIALTYWHGGSVGGDEDVDKFHYEICEDCARALSYTLRDFFENKNAQ